MPFVKGESGNKNGRPKLSEEKKKQRDAFNALLLEATVPALKNIIAIANEPRNKDRFNACKFIIEKAYGNNPALIDEDIEPIEIRIIRQDYIKDESEDW